MQADVSQGEVCASLKRLRVVGVQLEFPSESEVILALRQPGSKFPQTRLVVLSEYALVGPVPGTVKGWGRETHRYLAAGGKELLGGG